MNEILFASKQFFLIAIDFTIVMTFHSVRSTLVIVRVIIESFVNMITNNTETVQLKMGESAFDLE